MIPVFVLLVIATFIMNALESKKVIETKLPDDRVSHSPTSLLQETQVEGERHLLMDYNGMLRLTFPVKKPANEFRIVVTGGSFAIGDPYVAEFRNNSNTYLGYGGIPDWLQADLSARYPSRRIKVINAGVSGGNSDFVRDVVEQLVDKANPDLMILITGNNEGFVAKTSVNDTLYQWILYRTLKRSLLPSFSKKERPLFPPQDPDNQAIAKNYQSNVLDMIHRVKNKGAQILVATMPINLKFQGRLPEDFNTLKQPEDDPFLNDGLKLMAEKKYSEAIRQFVQSKNSVFVARYLGECFEAMGDIKKSRDFYKIYVEGNPLGRARPSYNSFIRDTCKKSGCLLADLKCISNKHTRSRFRKRKSFLTTAICYGKGIG